MTSAAATQLLSLTSVHYESGDLLGYFLAYCTLLPILLSFSLIILFLVNRQLAVCQLGVGLIGNEVANALLKQWFAQPRPGRSQRTDYGMPSSHAQFCGFFCAYMLLLVWQRWRIRSTGLRWVYTVAVVLGSISVSYSRIYLHYHTMEQVLVGVSVGSLVASVYYWLVYRLIARPWLVQQLKRYRLMRVLQVHDCDHLPDLLSMHYQLAMGNSGTERHSKQ